MPAEETTIGELLKAVGYTTGCIGKWDVSNRRDIQGRIPNDQGFDHYWGTLGANDSGAVRLYENRKPLDVDRDMASLTRRYTDNGPWNNMRQRLRKKHNGAVAWGSSGPRREGKGSTWEGGVRVPCIVRWPDRLPDTSIVPRNKNKD